MNEHPSIVKEINVFSEIVSRAYAYTSKYTVYSTAYIGTQ